MTPPQFTIIVLYAIALLINAYMHGKPKEGNNNFWISLINAILILSILYWGDFFK